MGPVSVRPLILDISTLLEKYESKRGEGVVWYQVTSTHSRLKNPFVKRAKFMLAIAWWGSLVKIIIKILKRKFTVTL
jgi:hypothetical protein